VKNDDSQIWKHDWPPETSSGVGLILTVDDPRPLEAIRIWPDSIDPTRTVREMEVFLDAKMVFRGEVEGEFGSIVKLEGAVSPDALPEVRALLEAQSRVDAQRPVHDSSGMVMPILSYQNFEFQILDALPGNRSFALSMIRFYASDGQVMWFGPDAVNYEIANCASPLDVRAVFARRNTSIDAGFVPWSARRVDGVPKILAKFETPIRPVAIEIVNSDMVLTEEDLSVAKMQVIADNRSLWIGKLNRRRSGEAGGRKNSTFLFTVCDPKLKALIVDVDKGNAT
jgi:hypothetical protein